MENIPERHLECSECKKPIAICYTEIVGKVMYRVVMCDECPLLRQRLYGFATPTEEVGAAGLCCGICGLRADEIRMGALLGCSLCYEIFEEIIIHELLAAGRVPQKTTLMKKGESLHAGRILGAQLEENVSKKLLALHEALNETISREDYEQAAWLRDEIKALTEERSGDDKRKP